MRGRGGAARRGGATAHPRVRPGALGGCVLRLLPSFSPATLLRWPRMGARASQEPLARVGLRVLLPVLLLALLLLALVAPGAQGARGRGAADKNSHRRAASSFSQSVSSLFGEDNVRAAQKVGGAPRSPCGTGRPLRGRGHPGLGTSAACCSPG